MIYARAAYLPGSSWHFNHPPKIVYREKMFGTRYLSPCPVFSGGLVDRFTIKVKWLEGVKNEEKTLWKNACPNCVLGVSGD